MWKIEIQQFVSWKNFFFSETKIWTLWIVNKRTLDCFKLTNCFKLNHINKKQCQFEWSDPKADCLFYVSFYLVMLCWIFPSMFVFQGELVSIYSSLRHVAKSGLYSVSMPNVFNFAFDFHLFLIVVMLSYIPSKSLLFFLFCWLDL